MTAVVPTRPDVAAEAEFQLLACKNQLTWLAALANAIQLDHQYSGGRHALALAELAQYLDDTGFAGVDSAIEEFRLLAETPCAPQNHSNHSVARLSGSSLGERILSARECASLSQAELAKSLGVKQAAVSQLETGRTKRTAYLAEIARACRVDINWLAFGSEVN